MLLREVKTLRKRIVRFWDMPPGHAAPALVLLSAAFAAGALAGLLMAARVDGGGQESLGSYLRAYLEAAKTGGAVPPELAPALWESARWPLLTLLLPAVYPGGHQQPRQGSCRKSCGEEHQEMCIRDRN